MNYDHRYDDIINLPHPVSKNHRPMSREISFIRFWRGSSGILRWTSAAVAAG